MMHKWEGDGGHHPLYEGGGGLLSSGAGGYSHLTTGTPNSYHGDTFVPAVVFNVSYILDILD